VLDDAGGGGDAPCYITVSDGNGSRWTLVAKQHRVAPNADVLRRLRAILGRSSVRVSPDG
jgi:hypothetical protein